MFHALMGFLPFDKFTFNPSSVGSYPRWSFSTSNVPNWTSIVDLNEQKAPAVQPWYIPFKASSIRYFESVDCWIESELRTWFKSTLLPYRFITFTWFHWLQQWSHHKQMVSGAMGWVGSWTSLPIFAFNGKHKINLFYSTALKFEVHKNEAYLHSFFNSKKTGNQFRLSTKTTQAQIN